MSQDLRKDENGRRDRNLTSSGGNQRKNYEGFEGMNYEQIRQPFNPQYKDGNNSNDRRKDTKRPDEG